MRRKLRFLIVDGYAQKSRDEFTRVGMPFASSLYEKMIVNNAPRDVSIDFVKIFPCQDDYVPPTNDEMSSFDGCAFTGSSYSAYDEAEDVKRQVDLMGRTFGCGVSSFGSCWGLQIAAVALGGKVELNPKGREVGVGRKVLLTSEGRDHPMFSGKNTVFEAFESHGDEVTQLPKGAVTLAGNNHTRIQAMSVASNGVESWFVQYHPEYDLDYYADLIAIRTERMVSMEFFKRPEDTATYVAELKELHADPSRKDLKWKYGIDEDLTDNRIKQVEVANWVKFLLDKS